MYVLFIAIRYPDGRSEQLKIEADSVLIGSGSHCDIRLPMDQAAPEHVMVQVGGGGLVAQARALDPPPTVDGVPFTQTVLLPESTLGVGQTLMRLGVSDETRAAGDNVAHSTSVRKEKRSSPFSFIFLGISIVVFSLNALLNNGDEPVPAIPRDPPALWGAPETVCQIKAADPALSLARDLRAQADGKRERRPFRVQEGVAAVPIYERAAACFRVGGDEGGARAAEDAARALRGRVQDDYRMHQVRLEYAISREHWNIVADEVRTLIAFTDGKQSKYVEWLQMIDKQLRLKSGGEKK